jgi:hypothetical protein
MFSRHFNVCVITAKEILLRDLGLTKFTRPGVPYTLSNPQKVMRVEASNEMLQILKDLEADSFDGITADDESWFHYLNELSAMFAKSPCDVVPRTRKEIGMEKLCLLFSLPVKSC